MKLLRSLLIFVPVAVVAESFLPSPILIVASAAVALGFFFTVNPAAHGG